MYDNYYLIPLIILFILVISFIFWIKLRLLFFGERIRIVISPEIIEKTKALPSESSHNNENIGEKNNKKQGTHQNSNSRSNKKGNEKNKTSGKSKTKVLDWFKKRRKGEFIFTLYYACVKRNIYAEKKHGYFIWLPRNVDTEIYLFDKTGEHLIKEQANPNEKKEYFFKRQEKY